eukprot:sb/3464812/
MFRTLSVSLSLSLSLCLSLSVSLSLSLSHAPPLNINISNMIKRRPLFSFCTYWQSDLLVSYSHRLLVILGKLQIILGIISPGSNQNKLNTSISTTTMGSCFMSCTLVSLVVSGILLLVMGLAVARPNFYGAKFTQGSCQLVTTRIDISYAPLRRCDCSFSDDNTCYSYYPCISVEGLIQKDDEGGLITSGIFYENYNSIANKCSYTPSCDPNYYANELAVRNWALVFLARHSSFEWFPCWGLGDQILEFNGYEAWKGWVSIGVPGMWFLVTLMIFILSFDVVIYAMCWPCFSCQEYWERRKSERLLTESHLPGYHATGGYQGTGGLLSGYQATNAPPTYDDLSQDQSQPCSGQFGIEDTWHAGKGLLRYQCRQCNNKSDDDVRERERARERETERERQRERERQNREARDEEGSGGYRESYHIDVALRTKVTKQSV